MRDIHSFEPFWNEWYIIRELGKGSYGTVYLAQKESFGEKYYSAIKHIALPPREEDARALITEGTITDLDQARAYYEQMAAALRKEINVNYQLKGNTNIVSYEDDQIIEREDSPGYDLFIKMELLTSLDAHMAQCPTTVGDVIRLGMDICSALSILRKKHIVHRDIKPANIFLNDNGDYKLGDFGVAYTMDKASSKMSLQGTYTYVAPELVLGGEADYGVDMYSLGLVMFKLLNQNRGPFLPLPPAPVLYSQEESANQKRFSGEAIPAPALGPQALKDVVLKAVAFRPEDRWSGPEAMRRELELLQKTLSQSELSQVTLDLYGTRPLWRTDSSASNPLVDATMPTTPSMDATIPTKPPRPAEATVPPVPERPSQLTAKKKGATVGIIATAAILLLAAGAAGVFLMNQGEKDRPVAAVETSVSETVEPTSTTKPTPEPTPELTPEPTSEPTPEHTLSSEAVKLTLQPSSTPAPQPVVTAKPTPKPTPKPAATPESILAPTPEPTPEPMEVVPSGISLSRSNAMLEMGGSLQMSVTITPANAVNWSVSWSSSNSSVASVTQTGIVKAVGPGTAIITATTNNGLSATCAVTVNS